MKRRIMDLEQNTVRKGSDSKKRKKKYNKTERKGTFRKRWTKWKGTFKIR